ncbi:helix-turn-helix transcriptional regulator [Thalassotalea sp. G2M2-11]|uniref:helix-turn-helix domain-containing protein n=1 Tax=Thalassotalea sp. G2M2-11 TaxID=2787627 RepID=UPI0019D00332|nr:helix-turn-helix transcriptional regulator [Thalassotalea sp. G2M2-11]
MNLQLDIEAIKRFRSQKNWTQQQLADICDVSLRTIQRIEKTGISSIETLSALCSAFNTDKSNLLEESFPLNDKHEVKKLPELLGILLMLSIVTTLMLKFGHLNMFVDLVSGLFVGGVLIGCTLLTYAKNPKLSSSSYVTNSQRTYSWLFNKVAMFNSLSNFTLYGFLVAMGVETLLIIKNYNEPKLMGPALAVLIISFLYAIIFSELVIQVLKHNLIKQKLQSTPLNYKSEQAGGTATMTRITGMLLILLTVILAPSAIGANIFFMPAFIFIMLLVIVGAIISYGKLTLPLLIGALKGVTEERQLITIHMFLNYLSRLTISSGIIYLLVSLVSLLSTLDDGSKLYLHISESLIGPITAVVIYLCLIKPLMISLHANSKGQLKLSLVNEENKLNENMLKTYGLLTIAVVCITTVILEIAFQVLNT